MGERGPKPRKVQPWEQAYLHNLRVTFSVTEACEAQGGELVPKLDGKPGEKTALERVALTRRTVALWREKSKRFRKREAEIWAAIDDSLEASTLRKAIYGWLEPVFYKGKVVGAKPVFSPGLMIWSLERRRRERYLISRHDAPAGEDVSAFAREATAAIALGLAAIPESNGADPKVVDVSGSSSPSPES